MTSLMTLIVRPWRSSSSNRPRIRHVVVGLVARGPAQLVDAGPLGDGDPDLRQQHALDIEGDEARPVVHRAD